MNEIEQSHGDVEMYRLMRLVSEHIEATVLVLIVRKPDGSLAVSAPKALRYLSEPVAEFLGTLDAGRD